MKRRLLPILMTLVLVCALPIWAAFVTSGDVTNPLVCTAGATSPPDNAATRLKSAHRLGLHARGGEKLWDNAGDVYGGDRRDNIEKGCGGWQIR